MEQQNKVKKTENLNSYMNDYINEKDKQIIINNQNLVLITSKIKVSNVKFTYSPVRSTYSLEERYAQTFETIETIRKYIPNSYIVLFDNSNFSKYEITQLSSVVDNFINITNDAELNYYTNESVTKAFGDIIQQIKIYDYFIKTIDISNVKNFFKISGRYLINENFNYLTIYNNDANVIKKNQLVKDREYYYTSFYKLTNTNIEFYFNELKQIIKNETLYYNVDCEVIVGQILKKTQNLIIAETLGITQRIAIKCVANGKSNETFI